MHVKIERTIAVFGLAVMVKVETTSGVLHFLASELNIERKTKTIDFGCPVEVSDSAFLFMLPAVSVHGEEQAWIPAHQVIDILPAA